MQRKILFSLLGTLLATGACSKDVSLSSIPGHDSLAQDTTHKESPRLMPAENYMRSYLRIFGGLTPLQAQTALAAGGDGLFDSWSNYLAAMGLPNYAIDLPRGAQSGFDRAFDLGIDLVALQFFPKDRAGISPTCTSSASTRASGPRATRS